MLEEPYWKRLIDDATRARPDLAYKFKTSAQTAAEKVQPGSPDSYVAPSAPEPEVDIAYTDTNIMPGRPVHPFEVRVMSDENGVPTTIRCYKGLVLDAGNRVFTHYLKGTMTQPLKQRKRVTLKGNRGNVSGDQKDYTPSNYISGGPEQHKYAEFNDPIQTTWLPNYEGIATGDGVNMGGDPDPESTPVAYATGTYPIGKDSFTSADNVPYYDWTYTDGAMVRLFCYDDGDPTTRKWGIWGNSGLPTDLGANGFFILLAQIAGTEVVQFMKSDIVALGGAATEKRAFLVHPVAGGAAIEDGTANGNLATGVTISNFSGTTFFKLTTNWSGNMMTSASISTSGSWASSQSDTQLVLTIGSVTGSSTGSFTCDSYLNGSIWVERFKCGQSPAEYFVGGF